MNTHQPAHDIMITLRKLTFLLLVHKALCLLTHNSYDEVSQVQDKAGEITTAVGEPTSQSNDVDSIAQVRSCDEADEWRPVRKNWNANTDEFVRDRLSKNNSQGFTKALIEDFTRGVHDFNCSPEHQCSLASCLLIDSDEPAAREAYLTLMSIANMNSHLMIYLNGLELAQQQLDSFTFGFLDTFSIASNEPEFDPIWGQQITLVVSAFCAVAIAKINPEISYKFLGVVLSGQVLSKLGVLPGYVFESGHILLQAKQKAWSPISDFGITLEYIFSTLRQSIFRSGENLLQGLPDESGRNVADVLNDGSMIEPPTDNSEEVAQFVSSQIAAMMIDRVWRATHTYILGAPTESCEEDQRGPQDTKYCRKGDPNVYYAYMVPDSTEVSMVPWVSVRKPKGYDQLDIFGHDLNLRMAMESSISAFYSNVDDPFQDEEQRFASRIGNLFDSDSEPSSDENVDFHAFRLPVCYDPSGSQLVPEDKVWTDDTPSWKLRTKFGTKFPCRCGPNGAHTNAFRRYSGLDQVQKYRNWCGLPGVKGPQEGDGDAAIEVPQAWRSWN